MRANAAGRIPPIIRRVRRRVREPLYRGTIPAGLTDRRWFKYHSVPLGFAAEVTDVFASLVSLPHLLLQPLPPPSCRASCLSRRLEEVDGPLCPAPGYVLFFRASSTSQSDTPPHSAHFSPPLCQCTTDVDGRAAGRSGLRGFTPMTHGRGRERGTVSGFDFISRHEYAAARFSPS